MRVKKKILVSEKTSFLSRSFEAVMKERDCPLQVNYIELNIPGSTYSRDDHLYLGIESDHALLADDYRMARIIIRFEMFRALVRKYVEREIPRDLEDLLVAREMLKRGYEDDLGYLFYTYVLSKSVGDARSLAKFLIIDSIFTDSFYKDFFHDLIEKKAKPGKAGKAFLKSLKKDLLSEKHLAKAEQLYGEMLDAGD